MWVLSSFMGNLPKHVQCKHIQMVSNGVMWYHPFNEIEEVCSSMPDELHLRLYLQLSLGIFLALRGVISTRFMGDWAWCQISGWYGWGKMKMSFLTTEIISQHDVTWSNISYWCQTSCLYSSHMFPSAICGGAVVFCFQLFRSAASTRMLIAKCILQQCNISSTFRLHFICIISWHI